MRAIRRFTVRPVLPEPLQPLETLATNLRWSWHPETQGLFESLDGEAWRASGHDPVRFLGMIPADRLAALGKDRRVAKRVEIAATDLEDYLTGDRWYQQLGADVPQQVAYFSPEFGITAVLPQYSGGLGILAGDHLKTASDLGVPMIGVGLLYRHGYFRQSLTREGWQQEQYPLMDPDALPLQLLREPDGHPVRLDIGVAADASLKAHVWVASVGRIPLLLLDSDIEDNDPAHRDVTDRLYGGDPEHRLLQEVLLGVGGVRALRAYSRVTGAAAPEVYHTNEGHAGFLGVERMREFVVEDTMSFDAAQERTRAATVFTTHTPVAAGIDRFPRTLVEMQFGGANAVEGMPVERILALGAEDYDGGDEGVFNMAVMGLRLAGHANGVSRLHGQVSREMFAGLWPGFEYDDIPIQSVTNGVHAPTWLAPEVLALAEEGEVLPGSEGPPNWEAIDAVPAEAIWATKRRLREKLVASARQCLRLSWQQRGASDAELGWIDTALDPDVLTIGFARRGASYKRLTLMLRDTERFKRLLLDPDRPIQVVIAGKAHPADDGGKRLIQEVVRFADDPEVRHRIVFLPDYDIGMAQWLYPGCDIWLNNPLRPYEACGTSGMKAALNGALNLSIRDGWWEEWYDGNNGWAIPSADGVDDPERRDELEAAALYDMVEGEVVPRFYDVNGDDLPSRWLEMVRHTLKSLGPKVLAARMLRDYISGLYTPACRLGRVIDAEPDLAAELAGWKHRVREEWAHVRIEHVETSGISDAPSLGSSFTVRVYAALGGLTTDDVDVQVAYGRVGRNDELAEPAVASLEPVEHYDGSRHRLETTVSLQHTGPFGYTVRICPKHDLLASPADVGVLAWPPSTAPSS